MIAPTFINLPKQAQHEDTELIQFKKEKWPGKGYEQEVHGDLQCVGHAIPGGCNQTVASDQHPVVHASDDKVPPRTVPQPAGCKDNQDVADVALVAAQRNVNIVT